MKTAQASFVVILFICLNGGDAIGCAPNITRSPDNNASSLPDSNLISFFFSPTEDELNKKEGELRKKEGELRKREEELMKKEEKLTKKEGELKKKDGDCVDKEGEPSKATPPTTEGLVKVEIASAVKSYLRALPLKGELTSATMRDAVEEGVRAGNAAARKLDSAPSPSDTESYRDFAMRTVRCLSQKSSQ